MGSGVEVEWSRVEHSRAVRYKMSEDKARQHQVRQFKKMSARYIKI